MMCGDERSKNVYWVMGFVRRHLTIQGQLDINGDI